VVVIEMLLYLYAESPVHAGAADSLGALDLPIQREATTAYPVVWGQSLKGALRQAARDAGPAAGWDPRTLVTVFGSDLPQPGEESAAGALSVGDAQLVAMPVPTLQKTYAWAASSVTLGRLARKYRTLGLPSADGGVPRVPSVPSEGGAAAGEVWVGGDQVVGPCVVGVRSPVDADLQAWAARVADHLFGDDELFGFFAAKLRSDLLLVGDDVMPVLVRECTESAARVQLYPDGDQRKTVQNGPFYSEYLPAETVLAASLTLRPPTGADGVARLRALLGGDRPALVRLGGDETLGKGLVWTRLVGGGAG
jgi:CRISPR-associated protein Cmr4